MIDKELINEKLKTMMTINGVIHKRYYHSFEVVKMALKLNRHLNLNLDEDKVYLSALLHDVAKLKSDEELWQILEENESDEFLEEIKDYQPIWHSFAGKYVVKRDFLIDDVEIQDAIYYHTTGKKEMTTLQKLIFVSDYIEESRSGSWVVAARSACFLNLDYGVKIILNQMVDYLKKNFKIIYGKSFEAFDYYNKERK